MILNGYAIYEIVVKKLESPFFINNGEDVLQKLEDAYLMAERGMNFP